jgi:hypothetical protein
MGLLDSIRGLFSGSAAKNFATQLAALGQEEVVKLAVERIRAESEDQAKGMLSDLTSDVLKRHLDQLTASDPTGTAKSLGDKIVDEATPMVVEQAWDKVKDRIVVAPAGH